MGAWAPVAIVGIGAIGIVILVIAVNSSTGGGSDDQPSVVIPERTVPTFDRTLGYEEAPLTVQEYSDFQCPYCAQVAATMVPQIEEEFIADKRVKLEYRYMAFIGDESVWAAEAAECAGEQDRFWDYHDTLFENQEGENKGAFAIDKLKQFAEEIGLDTQAFNECIDSHRYKDHVEAETQAAQDQGVSSTPTFIVGDQIIRGPRSYGEIKRAIETALSTDE